MRIIVQKYGGSSVADAQKVNAVADRIIATKKAGYGVVTVVSAQGDTTDRLIEKAYEITDNPPTRELDMLLATGEQVSIALLAMAIAAKGEQVVSLTGPQCGIKTDSMHTRARILDIDPKRILTELNDGKIVIVAGFQGIDESGDITTLGRGGSDTTAVAVAAAVGAECCEIYTDVDGVYTADPRIVPNARKLDQISYGEMLEMARLGANVLQPRAVECAAFQQVPIVVRSSFSSNPGTIIKGDIEMENNPVVVGVTHDLNVAKVMLRDVPDRPGVAAKIFMALAEDGINVDMIVQTPKETQTTDLLFSIALDDLRRTLEIAEDVAEELGATGVVYNDNLAKVSIVGAGMVSNPGVAARMFQVLAENNINIEVISTSEIKVSCLIRRDQAITAVRAIHDHFKLGEVENEL